MPARPSCLLLVVAILFLFLSACASTATPVPTTDQGAVATIVTGSQTALAGTEIPTVPPTAQPTEPEPTLPPATATLAPTPTAEPTPAVHIAYIKNGDVHLWTEGNGSIGLTDTHDAVEVQISEAGALVAYLRQDPNNMFIQELWVVNTDSPADPRVLISSIELAALIPPDAGPFIGGIGIRDFTFRHNAHELVYDTIILHDGPGFSPRHDLRVVNADTLVKTTLLENGDGGLFYLSPDGNQVALSKPESISIVNADGTNLRRDVLTFPEVITYSEYQYHPKPIWAADGNSLRVTIPPADPLAEPLQATGLWAIPVDGSPAVLLGNVFAIPFAWPNNAFAPDLAHVAYVMDASGAGVNQRQLHLSNPDGSDDVIYDQGEGLEFTLWSPDSKHFIYHIHGETEPGTFLGAAGVEPRLISTDALVSIQWIDSQRFAYLAPNGDQWELHLANLNGDPLAFIDTIPNSYPITFTIY